MNMKKAKQNSESLLDLYNKLSLEEQEALFQLVNVMAEASCKRETGYSIKDYNKALEIAESETAYSHTEVLNDIHEWLSNKKKKAIA